MVVKRGQTIVAERERTESESERLMIRQKEAARKRMTAAIFITAVVMVATLVMVILQFIFGRHKEATTVQEEYVISTEIVDERGDGYAEKSDVLKKYISRLEQDFKDVGFKLSRVVIPASKIREVDAYLEGRGEYYKCQLDRGTAETAEDVSRMVRYLDEYGVSPTYVDVRIEGKAYYL